MAKQQTPQQPGPGRSTQQSAFDTLRQDIAQQNERAQREARELRAGRDRARIRQRIAQEDEWTAPRQPAG
jgi:hypothetical protein